MKRSRIAFKLVSLIIVMSMLLTAGPMGTASAQSTIQGFVDVSNEAGFRSALSASNTINVQNDIIVTGGPLIVTQSPTTILGNGHTLTFSGLTADQDGLDIRADDTLVTGLTVDAGLSAPISWQGTFAIQVYDSLDIILTNVTAKNANGGILVNSSTVDISNVTTTGNSHYGINVDQGGGLTTTPLLTVNSVTNHTSPASGITPAIYVDTGIAAWVSFTEGIYKTVSDPVYGLMLYDLTEYAAELTAELAFVQANTTLTGTLDNLNATFPPTIPYFVQYEPYKINSCYTLGAALPTDTIVILVRGTKQIYSGQIGALKEFCYTELVGGTPADFDAGYAGATEHYEITVTGPGTNPLDFDTTLKIESIISKDSFATPVVLAEITLDVHIDDAVAPTIASGVAYGVASYTNITADPTLTFTVPQGYEVSTIKFTMDEAVTVVAGTQVSLAGFPYGDVAVDSTGLIVTVTPLTGNEVAAQLGTFTFSVPADAIKDLAGNALTTLSASLIVTDQTAPVMESVLPAEGEVVLGPTETFKLIVDALDLNLFKLEVDHNIVGLDEFSVYASASNVYGSPEAAAAFATAGVVVTYDATEQVWVIDFGTTVTDAFVMNGGVTFYLVLHDYADNKWGSMYDLSLVDNTYAYTIRRQDAAPVATLVTIPGTTNDVKVTFDQDVYLDGVALQSVPVSTAAEKLAFLQIFFGNPSLTAAMFNADNITIDLTSDSVTITMGDNAINPALFEALDDADTGTGDPWVGDGNGVYRIDVDVNTGAFENRDEIPCATDLEAFKIKFSVPMVNGVAQYGEPIVAIFQTAEQRALDVDPLPDMTAPTVNSMVAKGVAPYADVPAVGMTFTVPQGYEVSTIEITMSEPVTVVAVTEVTLNSVPYGLVT